MADTIEIPLNGKPLSEYTSLENVDLEWKEVTDTLGGLAKIRSYEEIVGVEVSEKGLSVKVQRKKFARSQTAE